MQFWKPFAIYIPRICAAERSHALSDAASSRCVPPSASTGIAYSYYPIQLPADPTQDWQAATKHYVDTHSSTPPPATTSTLGSVICDGTTITCAGDGTITAAALAPPQVLEFTTSSYPAGIGCSGTNPYICTGFPIGAHQLQILAISGGGGGGSGATCTNASTCFGGGGGSAGGMVFKALPATFFGTGATTTVTVTVGTGGTGGAAQSGTSASGNAGGLGTVTKICGASYPCIAASPSRANGNQGSAGGSGGTATTGTGGTFGAGGGWTTNYTCPGQSGASGTPGNYGVCDFPNAGALGGTGGAGLVSSASAAGGAQPVNLPLLFGLTISNTAGGAAGGGNGNTPTFPGSFTGLTFPYQVLGGTGGGSNCAGNGGTGGDGMTPGGGAGGGGAACNGNSSGAGGKGGDGFVRIIVQ